MTTLQFRPVQMLAACLATLFMVSGCGPLQAYPGTALPSYKTAILQINPPQANIGFQLNAVNDRPFSAEVSVAILPGSTKLTLQVWPTSSNTFQESDPAFAEHYQRIDQKYARMATISFNATAGRTYGLSGEFNQGTTPGESSFSINVFDTETKEVVARSSSSDIHQQADQKVKALEESRKEEWSLQAGPGS
jgi:hypothetical protein